MKILLLISFTLAAIASTRCTNSSEARDITTLLNNTMAKNFQNMDSETICSFIRSMELLNSPTSFGEVSPGVFYYFTGLKVESASLRHEFHSKTMAIFFTSLSVEMRGYLGQLGPNPDTSNENFALSLNFKNISIYAIAGSQYGFWDNEIFQYIDFESYESNYIYSPRFYENSTPEIQHELETLIKSLSPSLLQFNLRKNEDFMQILNATFCQHPEDEITSYYPSLDIVETKCYFFISNFTSLHRTLSNITIIGMHNFHSHSFVDVSTLIIEDIQGTTNLHYDGRNFTIFPLHFEIDYISISVDREQQSIKVTAHNYTIIETKMNVSLTEYQSKWVMEGIQLAIASSIMPSMKYYRNQNNSTNSLEEHPIVKISTKLSQQFEGRTIQKLYDTWNKTIPESFNTESSIQIGSYIYNISIDGEPITELKPYPDYIQCNLYNNLQVYYEIFWHGQIGVFNTTHKFDHIDFVTPKVFVELIKQNISTGFELKSFHTNYEIMQYYEVKLSSIPRYFTDLERLEIAQKTQQLMISLIKKTVIPFTEPLISLSLDYCYTPLTIFDDFLPFYADQELPFRVPDDSNENDSSTSKITNVIITQWTKSPSVSVKMIQGLDLDKSYLVDKSMTRIILSTDVSLQLAQAEIRMNFNDSSIPFDELHLTLTDLEVRNYTFGGYIEVHLDSIHYVPPDSEKTSFLRKNLPWIEKKLQGLLGNTFNRLTRLVF
ncbi:uncharacterized protein LOC135837325 isoform X2 [Planococcus citri]|uniref:uncharacterized protein LOC135837325 isoform X2 n=1 Tax=Planococcus citri TaxID=170843 RepID=UPI0031F97938